MLIGKPSTRLTMFIEKILLRASYDDFNKRRSFVLLDKKIAEYNVIEHKTKVKETILRSVSLPTPVQDFLPTR